MEPIRLVIVEDDPMVMEINLEFISRLEGFKVVGKAFNGTDAWQIINETEPDLILLDYFLPDTNGFSLLKKIRQRDLPADIILVTANRDPYHVQQILRYGAVDYIFKPFRFERFRTALDKYRKSYTKFQTGKALQQMDLDILTGIQASKQPAVKEEDLPKGLNSRTLKQILQYLEVQLEPLSAEDVAAGIGLARVTARRYLEYLQKMGNVSLEIQYGSVGRPVNRYMRKSQG